MWLKMWFLTPQVDNLWFLAEILNMWLVSRRESQPVVENPCLLAEIFSTCG